MLHYLPDLESDMSVFHRIDDMYSMPAPRFFRLAYRIAAYDGMLARRIEAAREREKQAQSRPAAPPGARRTQTQRPAAGRLKQGAQMMNDRALGHVVPGLFERATSAPKSSPRCTGCEPDCPGGENTHLHGETRACVDCACGALNHD